MYTSFNSFFFFLKFVFMSTDPVPCQIHLRIFKMNFDNAFSCMPLTTRINNDISGDFNRKLIMLLLKIAGNLDVSSWVVLAAIILFQDVRAFEGCKPHGMLYYNE